MHHALRCVATGWGNIIHRRPAPKDFRLGKYFSRSFSASSPSLFKLAALQAPARTLLCFPQGKKQHPHLVQPSTSSPAQVSAARVLTARRQSKQAAAGLGMGRADCLLTMPTHEPEHQSC